MLFVCHHIFHQCTCTQYLWWPHCTPSSLSNAIQKTKVRSSSWRWICNMQDPPYLRLLHLCWYRIWWYLLSTISRDVSRKGLVCHWWNYPALPAPRSPQHFLHPQKYRQEKWRFPYKSWNHHSCIPKHISKNGHWRSWIRMVGASERWVHE